MMAKRKTKKTRPVAPPPTKPPIRPTVQAALPLPDPVEPSFTAELRKRLGHRAFVSVSLVASACDVSVMTVFSWIQSGVVEARNVSVAERPYYRIFAPSVIRFFERMEA
jgi:hypothetical protein